MYNKASTACTSILMHVCAWLKKTIVCATQKPPQRNIVAILVPPCQRIASNRIHSTLCRCIIRNTAGLLKRAHCEHFMNCPPESAVHFRKKTPCRSNSIRPGQNGGLGTGIKCRTRSTKTTAKCWSRSIGTTAKCQSQITKTTVERLSRRNRNP